MQPPEEEGGLARVVVRYVGKREPRHRDRDVWTVLHDLFGVTNPPGNHVKPPCCATDVPDIDDADLDVFLKELPRFHRTAARRPAGGNG